jgi:hypothetical protein
MLGYALHQLNPVWAQKGFAADQRDLARSQVGQLVDNRERFFGGELINAPLTRARTAMGAFEIAG